MYNSLPSCRCVSVSHRPLLDSPSCLPIVHQLLVLVVYKFTYTLFQTIFNLFRMHLYAMLIMQQISKQTASIDDMIIIIIFPVFFNIFVYLNYQLRCYLR